jgi:hypothetical protein
MPKAAFLIVSVLSLAGCGGGSSTVPSSITPPAATSPAFIQVASAVCHTGGPGPQCSNTFSINITTKAGNAILVPFWFNGSNQTTVQVADSNNDVFSAWATVPTADLNDSPSFLYATKNAVGGAVTINLTFNIVPSTVYGGALEYSGVTHGTDASITASNLYTQQTQGQVFDSASFVTHLNNELVFGLAVADFGVQSGNGWTPRLGCTPSQPESASGYFCFEEQPGPQMATFDATFVTNFHSPGSGGLGAAPSPSAPNGSGVAAFSIY